MGLKPESTFKFKVEIFDYLDSYKEEDIVKQIWPSMYSFLTKRNGLNKGEMILENGAVKIYWTYCGNGSEEWWDTDTCCTCGQEVKND
jgi:hypothetical protein